MDMDMLGMDMVLLVTDREVLREMGWIFEGLLVAACATSLCWTTTFI